MNKKSKSITQIKSNGGKDLFAAEQEIKIQWLDNIHLDFQANI